MARVPAGGQRVDGEEHVVAVRADEGDAALDLAAPHPGQGRGEPLDRRRLLRLLVDRALRLEGDPLIGAGDDRVLLRDDRLEVREQRRPRVEQLAAGGHEALVPDREGLGVDHAAAAAEQAVALPQRLLVVADHAGQPGRALHEQLVDEAAAGGGLAPHDREVLRCEQHARHVPRDLARADRGAVELGPVRPDPVHEDLGQHLPVRGDDRRADHGAVLAGADEGRVAGDPVGAEGREEPDRLDQVRLALPVAAGEHVRAGGEDELGRLVVAPVRELQSEDAHREVVPFMDQGILHRRIP